MGETTFKSENINRPAPKWWRKLEDGLLMILIPAAIAIITGWGGLDDLKSTRAILLINVGLVALIKFIGKMLANGEEYAKSDTIKVLIVLLCLTTMLGSCTTSKNVQKENAVLESESYKRLQSLYEATLRENSVLKQQIREMESVGVVFQECPPTLNTDSLINAIERSGCSDEEKSALISKINEVQKKYQQSQAEIKRLADGTLEIKGNLASFKQSKERIEEILSETVRELKEKQSLISDLENKLKEEQSKSAKAIKRTYFPPLFWIITALFAALWIRKQFFNKPKIQL